MKTATLARWACAVLVAACLVTYWPVLGFDFVDLDDPLHLLRNDAYRGLGLEQLRWMFLELHGSAGYDPIAWLSYGVDHALFGLDSAGFHRTQLVTFVLCAVAFFALAQRFLVLARVRRHPLGSTPEAALDSASDAAPRAASATPSIVLAAAIVTLVWALHPLRAESVAWVSERHGLLATLFALLSTHQYLRLRGRRPAFLDETGPWFLSLSFFTLALLSKSTVSMLPFCFLLLDATLLGRLHWPLRFAELNDRIVEKAPFFGLAFFIGLITIVAREESGMGSSLSAFAPGSRLAQAALGLAYYPWKTLVPTGLSPIQLQAEWQEHLSIAYVVSAVACIAALGIAWIMRRRAPAILPMLMAYALLLLPVLGLFQSGPLVVADRYSLLGLVPVFLVLGIPVERGIAWLLAEGRRRRRPILAVATVCALLLCAEAWATRQQLAHWRDADALWSHALAASFEPALIWQNRGAIRMQLDDYEGADDAFDRALVDRSADAWLVFMAGQNAALRGDPQRAIGLLSDALVLAPESSDVWRARGRVHAQIGQWSQAIADLQKASELKPDDPEILRELGGVMKFAAGAPAGANAPSADPTNGSATPAAP